MRTGEIDILVGTQMVTKGHDLPAVTLVGVVNADAALCMPDFRASERAFQLLVQVAGRAGRREKAGKVLVQTRSPEHPAIQFAASTTCTASSTQELRDRNEVDYPPFCRLALVRVDAVDEEVARAAAARLASAARVTTGRTRPPGRRARAGRRADRPAAGALSLSGSAPGEGAGAAPRGDRGARAGEGGARSAGAGGHRRRSGLDALSHDGSGKRRRTPICPAASG